MIRGQAVSEKINTRSAQLLTQEGTIAITITSEFQQELAVMTSMCQMPELPRRKVSILPCHDPEIYGLEMKKRPQNRR